MKFFTAETRKRKGEISGTATNRTKNLTDLMAIERAKLPSEEEKELDLQIKRLKVKNTIYFDYVKPSFFFIFSDSIKSMV